MDFILEESGSLPPPERLQLFRFEIGPADDRDEHWQLIGEGQTWTLRPPHDKQSNLLAWLWRNGYLPIEDTDPPTFQRFGLC
jgi:hypothetical protein